MRFVRTVVVFDRGGLMDSDPWARMHTAYRAALGSVVHPPGNSRFVVRKKIPKLDSKGKRTGQWVRNGVKPIREQFLKHLTGSGWRAERPVKVALGIGDQSKEVLAATLKDYPSKQDFVGGAAKTAGEFRQELGDFDFYHEIDGKTRCVIEWETGNVSSSHRSLNKLCLVLMAGLIDIGVLVVPSRALYPHLTDRIGNWEELTPYMAYWHQVGRLVERGLLAVTVVEHDELTEDPLVPFIVQGPDGRSAEGASKLL
jgi:hypothetical protein